MAIPDFQSLMLPALRYVASKPGEVPVRAVSDALAKEFNLTEEDLNILLPSGRAPQFYNRVQWAITHMRKAAVFATPRRACVSITQRGRDVLAKNPKRVDLRLLSEFPEYQEFRAKKQNGADTAISEATAGQTPLEVLESSHQSLRAALATEVLDRVRNKPWLR